MFAWSSHASFSSAVYGGTGLRCTHMEAAWFRRPLSRLTRDSILVRARILIPPVIPLKFTDVSVIVLGGPPPMFTRRLSAWEIAAGFRWHSFASANSLPLPRTLTRHRGGTLPCKVSEPMAAEVNNTAMATITTVETRMRRSTKTTMPTRTIMNHD